MTSTTPSPSWGRDLPDPMVPARFRVDTVRRELAGVFSLDLTAADGAQEFPFRPGQFNMLYQFGAGEVPISISGDPTRLRTLTHTIRAVGGVTEAMQRLQPGLMLGVRGPFGAPWPTTEAEGADLVILAGGIGLAPLRPLIYHVLNNRKRYGAVCIYYGARSPEEMLYRDELTHWRSRFDLSVDVTVDHAAPDWMGRVGVVTRLLSQKTYSPVDSIACLCGPEIMMRFAVDALKGQGLGNDQIYLSVERSMKCALGFCGHCQYGGDFVCRDGPVFRFDTIADRFNIREL